MQVLCISESANYAFGDTRLQRLHCRWSVLFSQPATVAAAAAAASI